MTVAIIGGGWAGLAAAVELAAAGVAVTVFEAAKQLGGRARSVELQGQRLDNGQHLLVGAYRETLRLMQAVGADPERLLLRLPLEIHFPGAHPTPFRLRLPRLPAPWHLAAGLLRAGGASLSEKFAAVRFIRYLQKCNYRIGEDCTVSALLDRHRQRGSLRRHLWEPLCLAALNTPPDDASAQIFANTLRDSLGADRVATDLLLPAADLDRLFPEAAANFLRAHGGEIRLSTRIQGLEAGLSVAGKHFDQIIIAVGPEHAQTLLGQHAPTRDTALLLSTYAFEPIGTVYCRYPPHVRLPFPMLGLAGAPRGGRERVGQWVFDRGALCGSAGLLAFVLSGRGAWDELDNATLAATLHAELAATLRNTVPAPLPAYAWHQVIRERRATFSCRPNLARPATATALAGVWLAGDYVCGEYPATLEAAVRSGVAAASGILSQPQYASPKAQAGS